MTTWDRRRAGRAGLTIGVLGVIGLLTAGCSSSEDPEDSGAYPSASRFGAQAIPCEETQTFYSTTCCEVQAGQTLAQECWVRESKPDIAHLITEIRDAFAPEQDPEERAAPECQYRMGRDSIAECAIGGVVSSDPYTVVSVTARPAYSSDEIALLLNGTDVDAEVVEVYIRVTELGSAIDQWVDDQSGTHID